MTSAPFCLVCAHAVSLENTPVFLPVMGELSVPVPPCVAVGQGLGAVLKFLALSFFLPFSLGRCPGPPWPSVMWVGTPAPNHPPSTPPLPNTHCSVSSSVVCRPIPIVPGGCVTFERQFLPLHCSEVFAEIKEINIYSQSTSSRRIGKLVTLLSTR